MASGLWWRSIAAAAGLALGACATANSKPAEATSGTTQPSVVVEIADEQVSVAGERVENETKAIRAALSLACADYPALALRAAPSTHNDTLMRVLREVAQAPSESIQLELGELHLQVRSRLSRKSPAHVAVNGVAQDERVLVWVEGKQVAAFTSGVSAEEQGVRELVQQACGAAGPDCGIDLRLLAKTPLVSALGSWQRVTAPFQSTLTIDIRDKQPGLPTDPNVAPSRTGGRLPPPVIQRIVRAHFPAFRTCYEAGLGRDSKLKGLVNARFIIGRDGKVTNVADHGSSLPDRATVDCVLRKVYELVFPAPDGGGIVTVIYPIMLQPEGEVSR